ncbi:MAG: transcriptional regulator GutM [Klebsiella grimontii]|nr:transcriptional regulator GutM [Klebsiella grimontii]
MVTALITVAAIAWITQLAFGGWQIRQFNRAFDRLCQQGRVGVGRSSGRFKPRAVVAIAVDEDDRIRKELQPDVIFPNDPLCQNALSLALNPKHG